MSDKFVTLLLDSGAYSAWAQGDSVNIDEYIAFVKANEHLIWRAVNLDCIPGRPGNKGNQIEVEESAQKSYDNLQYMKKHGLNPMPVFHQGERFEWLLRLIAEGEDYIGISPMEGTPYKDIQLWMDQVFGLITDDEGRPKIQTHGFGVMSFGLMMRYPWTSCDATTWVIVAGYGRILVPPYTGGKPDYTKPPLMITISAIPHKSADAKETHFDRLGPTMRSTICRYLEEEVGTTLFDARHDYVARTKANVYYYKTLMEQRGEVRFKHRRKGLLG